MELALIGVCLAAFVPLVLLLLVKCVLVFLEEERERAGLGAAQQRYMEAASGHSYARALDALLRTKRPYRRPSPQGFSLATQVEELLAVGRETVRETVRETAGSKEDSSR